MLKLQYNANDLHQSEEEHRFYRSKTEANRDRKYTYIKQDQKNSSNNRQNSISNHRIAQKQNYNERQIRMAEQIENLKRELLNQKEKYRILEKKTISEQEAVLNQLSILQNRFSEMRNEKEHLQHQLNHFKFQRTGKNQQTMNRFRENEWRQKYEQLQSEHKKVKNIQNSMINMMKKVDGLDGDLHQAWRWIKKVIWEYETVRKKALEWKRVYDEVNEFEQQKNNQSSSSDSNS